MNQPKALDLTGGWEQIVNNVDRHNARMNFEAKLRRRKLQKKVGTITELALGAVLSVTLGLTGLLNPWISWNATAILVCSVCFLGGRLWAVIKT